MNRIYLACCLLLLSACGQDTGLADLSYPGQTLATVHGRLELGSAAAPSGPVSMAIFWMPSTQVSGVGNFVVGGATVAGAPTPSLPVPDFDCSTRQETFPPYTTTIGFVSQALSYEPQFPINFQIPIQQLPPQAVRVDLAPYGGSGVVALGVVNAFTDEDGDGNYSFGYPGKEGELLLGTSVNAATTTLLTYLNGVLPPEVASKLSVPQGFSILEVNPLTSAVTVKPVSTPVTLTLNSVQATEPRLCGTLEGRDAVKPEPADAFRICSDSGRSYQWSHASQAIPCSFEYSYGRVCLAPSAPTPANWPCP